MRERCLGQPSPRRLANFAVKSVEVRGQTPDGSQQASIRPLGQTVRWRARLHKFYNIDSWRRAKSSEGLIYSRSLSRVLDPVTTENIIYSKQWLAHGKAPMASPGCSNGGCEIDRKQMDRDDERRRLEDWATTDSTHRRALF
ncbi:hypothetical protein ABW21_db0207819 [Orbilia brochopaga]|nr:hypothetical protein ABW21_db0207819 [Drechslerella brochopaga]